MNALAEKLKEVVLAILPVTVIVLILHLVITPLPGMQLARFLIGAVLILIGLALLLLGVDLGISPIGSHIGASLHKSGKIWIIVVVGLVVGFFISIAEPDLQILSGQVDAVTSGLISRASILIWVSVGLGIMLALGLLRIVFNIPLYKVMAIIYGLIAILSLFVSPEILSISFDASGATTGTLTVPFILALALGASKLKRNSIASEEDSFGLAGIISTGAIFAVLLMGIFSGTKNLTGTLDNNVATSDSVLGAFGAQFSSAIKDAFWALIPLLVIFLVFQKASIHLKRKPLRRVLKGLLYTFIGLTIFLLGVNGGFMEVGNLVGSQLAASGYKGLIIVVGFVLGFVTIMAEPAVYVLTQQLEDVTSGYVKRKIVLPALCLGVGAAVALSMLRIIIPQIELWHFLLPGFGISVIMSFFTPDLFVGVAFDSGGVASGPMTATFLLAFSQGVADSMATADVLNAFGVIALVAMTPIITLQILGFIYQRKTRREKERERNA